MPKTMLDGQINSKLATPMSPENYDNKGTGYKKYPQPNIGGKSNSIDSNARVESGTGLMRSAPTTGKGRY